MEALQDPKRVFNQDETAGVGSQYVLAPRSARQVYNVSSSTREHVTILYTINAAGDMVPPRGVFAGKRDMAKIKLKDLPKDGKSGEWKFSYTENGWVKQHTFEDIVQDLGNYIKKKEIPIPVLLFMDGPSCHISLAISKLCDELGIQPILLRPNMTHLAQALNLIFFSSLKARFTHDKEYKGNDTVLVNCIDHIGWCHMPLLLSMFESSLQ